VRHIAKNVTVLQSNVIFCVRSPCWRMSLLKGVVTVKLFYVNMCCFSIWFCICLKAVNFRRGPGSPTAHAQCPTPQWRIGYTFLPRCMEYRRDRAMRILPVCLSVRLSVTLVDCDKTVERSVQIFIQYKRSFSLVFWKEKMVGRGATLLPEILGQPAPLERNRRFSADINS